MRLLDLFCGAGGAAKGYADAGFEVVGVDHKPQPRYPFAFIQADALDYLAAHGHEYDAIHASPPCQQFTTLRGMWNHRGRDEHPDLVAPTRELLRATGLPYVIENVPGSPLGRGSVMLCGTMFGLGTADGRAELRRHRYFEMREVAALAPHCQHRRVSVGVYGDGNGRDYRRHPVTVGVYGHAGGPSARELAQQFLTRERGEAMGIDWMTGNELSQAIPPAYTNWIGRRLMERLARQ